MDSFDIIKVFLCAAAIPMLLSVAYALYLGHRDEDGHLAWMDSTNLPIYRALWRGSQNGDRIATLALSILIGAPVLGVLLPSRF
jgi:hypothetical protein